MNPYVMLDIMKQRAAEQREAAWRAGRARALRKAIRAQRGRARAAGTFDLPPVPDYVDGTFRDAAGAVTEQVGADR